MSHILLTSSPRSTEGLSPRFATEIAERSKVRMGRALTFRDLAKPALHITSAKAA